MMIFSCSYADLLTGRVVAARAGEGDIELRPLREHGPLVQQRAVALQPPGHLQYSTVQCSTVHYSTLHYSTVQSSPVHWSSSVR